ncbi:MAG: hypothetical protein H7Y43_14310 [Akkermansiaceae bacterium]|nr:hypothetical protein [Verrucomicrobiales bacterium]
MSAPNHEQTLRRRINLLTWLFIIGLVISGVTAIPLVTELNWLTQISNANALAQSASAPAWALWLVQVRDALQDVAARHPMMFYGTDWLAFGHFAIAIAFIGALRDPVRNRWLFTFGLIACVLVVPYAFVMGAIRGIPIWWRLIDCSFGIFGAVPLWFCWKWTRELEHAPVRR